MFDTQTKNEGANIRIYRDARLTASLWLFSSLFFIFPTLAIKDKAEMLAALSILMAGNLLACLVFWYVLHGAIVLNKTRRQVEILKDLGLQMPHARYLADTIDQVVIKSFWLGGDAGSIISFTSYKIVLKLKGAQEGELDLFFFNEAACAQAAKTVAEFARVPAYDPKGRQIFNPKG